MPRPGEYAELEDLDDGPIKPSESDDSLRLTEEDMAQFDNPNDGVEYDKVGGGSEAMAKGEELRQLAQKARREGLYSEAHGKSRAELEREETYDKASPGQRVDQTYASASAVEKGVQFPRGRRDAVKTKSETKEERRLRQQAAFKAARQSSGGEKPDESPVEQRNPGMDGGPR